MEFLPLICLSFLLPFLAFWIVGTHCHELPSHKIYDPPMELTPAESVADTGLN